MNLEQTQKFILAGNARFTVRSIKTTTRFTYRVRSKEMGDGTTLHFVLILTGPDNSSDFKFLGTIFNEDTFRHGRKSRIGSDAPSAKAFAWVFPRLMAGMTDAFEIHHLGTCGRCGRSLSVPESISCGFGSSCAETLGIAYPKAPKASKSPAPASDEPASSQTPTPVTAASEPSQLEAFEL